MRRSPKDLDDSARKITKRALLLGGGMAAMVAVLGARMRYMQVDQADQFRLLAEENRINIRLIPPSRGLIEDRNGKVIAGNEQNYRVVITREDAGDVAMVLHRLSSLIPLSPEEIARRRADCGRQSDARFAFLFQSDAARADTASNVKSGASARRTTHRAIRGR